MSRPYTVLSFILVIIVTTIATKPLDTYDIIKFRSITFAQDANDSTLVTPNTKEPEITLKSDQSISTNSLLDSPLFVGVISASSAIFGGIMGSYMTNRSNRQMEEEKYERETERHKQINREKLHQNITYKYLIQVQYAVKSLYFRFANMANQGSSLYALKAGGDGEYYMVSTLYALGSVLSYHRIMLFEGVYSQIEDLYPEFGTLLIKKFEGFTSKLDGIEIRTSDSSRYITFFRYDRMALGDALTEMENGHFRISSYLNFKTRYETDSQIKSSLDPAREFVMNLPFASDDLKILIDRLKEILDELKSKTLIT